MQQLLKGIVLLILISLTSYTVTTCQVFVGNNLVTLSMTNAVGLDPHSITSSVIGKRPDQIFAEDEANYPVTVGKPADIAKQIEYYYLVNEFQFQYQNYVAGKISKDYFLKKVADNIWNINDTLYLSRKPLRCGISVLGGIGTDGRPVYILDANANNDYSDEVVRPITKGGIDNDKQISLSVPVTVDYFVNNQIKKETINTYISSGSPGNELADMSFNFPTFRYVSFSYEGKPYILWTSTEFFRTAVFLQADKSGIPLPVENNPIKINQYVTLGNKAFKLIRMVGNKNAIVLQGDDYSGFDKNVTTKPGITNAARPELESSQVGFTAPLIQGMTVTESDNKSTLISLEKYKGKYVFIDFWSTTCAPCIADFPELIKVYNKFDRSRLEIIGVVDERSTGATLALSKKHGLPWPNIKTKTAGTIIKGYDVISYPTTFLLDPDGKVIAQNLRGEDLMSKLSDLIQEKGK